VEPVPTLVERLKARSDAVRASPATPGEAAERERTRIDFMHQGETALSALDIDTALRKFEAAASILHSADSEMSLIRTYMQGGHYRRALSFSAHTAGAHLDTPSGAALYGWLLFLGGQQVAARSVIEGALRRAPVDPVVLFVATALKSDAANEEGLPLAPPARLAPYPMPMVTPRGVRMIASGTLIDRGQRVVVPGNGLAMGTTILVRNGLGQMSRGRVERILRGSGASIAMLERPLSLPEQMSLATRDPFPGSVAYAVEFAATADASPRWPMLHAGFAGSPLGPTKGRALGIVVPAGPRGGPVFDDRGRLVGIALPGTNGPDRLLLPSELPASKAKRVEVASAAADPQRMGIDEIYERALQVTVQVFAIR